MLSRALFIGRFQPLHNGHLDALEQIFAHPDHFDEVVIVIGSAENDFLPQDPCTAGERYEMLITALSEAGISREKIWILPVRNIDRSSLWPAHVASMCPDFSAVFSGSALIRLLWTESFGTKKKVYPLTRRLPVSSTLVREKIARNEDISALVPVSVVQFLKNHRVAERFSAS